MIKPIIKDDHPLLRQRSALVTALDHSLRRLVDDMVDTLNFVGGVGLAAVQIGVPKRVVIVAPSGRPLPITLVNPVIASHDDEQVCTIEGCLSVTRRTGLVSRYGTIFVSYLTPALTPTTQLFTGYEAVIVQHELDHLDGVLFTDKIIEQENPDVRKLAANLGDDESYVSH